MITSDSDARHPVASVRIALGLAVLGLLGLGSSTAAAQSFSSSGIPAGVTNPTSLQFGPDQRLYVSEQDGDIKVFTVQRNGPGDYAIVGSPELITQIKTATPNHDDDGSACSSACAVRQVTGLLVAGTANQPVLYVTSSDSRISVASDSGLDTNSGVVTRLTCTGGVSAGTCQAWDRVDIVRGLPRSEENHATNGMALDAGGNVLYVASGGNTNKGAIGNSFSGTGEYYLSGAILSVDLDAIAAIESANGGPFVDQRTGMKFVYDLPTLDDPTRSNIGNSHPDFPYPSGHPRHGLTVDPGDPFGGNNGLNQAIPEPGGPVQVHSPGYRNPYDVVYTASGELYTWDNGPNGGWGGTPVLYTSAGVRKGFVGESGVTYNPGAGDYCSNEINEQGSGDEYDTLVRIAGVGHYGGHPVPTRAFPNFSGLYNYVQLESGHWQQSGPVYTLEQLLPAGYGLDIGDFPNDPRQCDYKRTPTALEIVSASTNGLAEYAAGNFAGAMQGDLLAASFNGNIYRCKPDGSGGLVDLPGASTGTTHGKCEVLFGGFGSQPLDITAQGDGDVFPGTIWAATYGANSITVFEPVDFGDCDPSDPAGDADGDGYSNGDEDDNGTNPCSAGSKPDDFDGDFVSNLNDADDDGDGIPDVSDAFALDADNGLSTAIPFHYALFNNDPGIGLFGLGFTGLMLPLNGSDTWLDLFVEDELAAGGAAGLFTVEKVGPGDALGSLDSQHNGFQFGIDVDQSTDPFVVRTRLIPPYFEVGGSQTTPQAAQSYGLFVGTGDQDNYLKIVLNAASGGAGMQVVSEVGGSANSTQYTAAAWGGASLLAASAIDLSLAIDPQAATVLPRVSLDGGNTWHALGTPRPVPPAWLSAADAKGLAMGVISTARNPNGPSQAFGATWDFLSVEYGAAAVAGEWVGVDGFDAVRHEGGFVQAGGKFYMLGGREADSVRIWDPATGAWSTGANSPVKLHHFQAVTVDGLIYVVGALTGTCCQEPEAPAVYIYDPVANHWSTGPAMPAVRARGAGGAVAVGGKIYLVSGNTNGHYGPVSAQVDVFDPATGTFTPLANIPHPRDHFSLVHHGGKLYAAGGRITNIAADSDPHDDQVPQVDVYDIAANSWSTLPASANVPVPRAGAATGVLAGELVLAGGESGLQTAAHGETHALDLASQTWRTLSPMITPRHSAQAIVSNGGLYVAGGSDLRDAPSGVALDLEALYLAGVTAPAGGSIDPGTLSAPASVDFGTLAPGGSADRSVTVGNANGDQGIVVDAATVGGNAAFSLVSGPAMPFVLGPGKSAQFVVRFAPTGQGTSNATLTVQRSGGTDASVALTGKAAAAAPKADLSVSVSEDNDPVAEGASLMYTVIVHNDGPATATNVAAETTLSPLVSNPTTVGCSGDPTGVPTCLLGSIPAGGEVVWLITVDVDGNAGGSVASSIVSVSAAEDDPDNGNNDATATTDVISGAPGEVADLSVLKTAATEPGSGSVTYSIVVSNAGPDAVANASVVDLVPNGLSNVAWTCSATAGGFCTASGTGSIDELVDLPAGASATFVLTANYAPGSESGIVNTAVVNVPQGTTDPDPEDNESSADLLPVIFADGFESP